MTEPMSSGFIKNAYKISFAKKAYDTHDSFHCVGSSVAYMANQAKSTANIIAHWLLLDASVCNNGFRYNVRKHGPTTCRSNHMFYRGGRECRHLSVFHYGLVAFVVYNFFRSVVSVGRYENSSPVSGVQRT